MTDDSIHLADHVRSTNGSHPIPAIYTCDLITFERERESERERARESERERE